MSGAPRFLVLVAALALASCSEALARDATREVMLLVAARDLRAGDTLQLTDLAQRAFPAELATKSMVRPEAASYLLGALVQFPLLKDDLLRWPLFETVYARAYAEQCQGVTASAGETASDQIARARQVVSKRAR